MAQSCNTCGPSAYGYPGQVTPQYPQNRLLPTWKGCVDCGPFGGLRGLFGRIGSRRAGDYRGAIGKMYARAEAPEMNRDMQHVRMMGLAGLGFSGAAGLGGLGSAASDRCNAAQVTMAGTLVGCALITNAADRERCQNTARATYYALCPDRDPSRIPPPVPTQPVIDPTAAHRFNQSQNNPPADDNKLLLYGGIAAGVLVLGGVGYLIATRKKR